MVLINEFEITRGKERIIFKNSATDAHSFFSFYQAMSYLIEAGLSAERVKDTAFVGPPLSAAQASDPRLLAALSSSTATSVPRLAQEKTSKAYRLSKDSSSYRFCFDPTRSTRARELPNNLQAFIAPTNGIVGSIHLGTADRVPIPELTLSLHAADQCGASAEQRKKVETVDQRLKFRPRSVEGVFLFLGEMARTELGLKDGQERSVALHSTGSQPRVELFKISRGLSSARAISVGFDGNHYSVEIDPSGEADKSSRVIQLLTELLALQSSAKNLPTPALVTVIGQ